MGAEQHCTCGLVVDLQEPVTSNIEYGIRKLWVCLALDRVQLQTGHRNLPSFSGISPAILVNFEWIESKGIYLWDGICQTCGECGIKMQTDNAKYFNFKHNKDCN